jgi:hypothetical protein
MAYTYQGKTRPKTAVFQHILLCNIRYTANHARLLCNWGSLCILPGKSPKLSQEHKLYSTPWVCLYKMLEPHARGGRDKTPPVPGRNTSEVRISAFEERRLA